jgi:hypothetical protein
MFSSSISRITCFAALWFFSLSVWGIYRSLLKLATIFVFQSLHPDLRALAFALLFAFCFLPASCLSILDS